MTFAATRHVSWALNAPKLRLRPPGALSRMHFGCILCI